MSDVSIVLTVLGVTILLFVWNRFPVEIVAISASLALVATGILTTNEALAGFGDPTVVFIASLFVVSTALDQTGVTAWAGQQLLRAAGESRTKLMLATMVLAALMTAIISVNGAVAALLPMVVVMAVRLRQPTSQMLLPLAFAAHAGFDAGAHRHARQRPCRQRRGRGGRRPLRLLRVRVGRHPAADRRHHPDPVARAPSCFHTARRRRCHRTSALTPARSDVSTSGTGKCFACSCRPTPQSSTARPTTSRPACRRMSN